MLFCDFGQGYYYVSLILETDILTVGYYTAVGGSYLFGETEIIKKSKQRLYSPLITQPARERLSPRRI